MCAWSLALASRVAVPYLARRPHVPQQQRAVPKQRPQLCFPVGAGGGGLWWGPCSHPSAETGMGVAQPAWQPGLCFERNVLMGGGAVLIQTWLRWPLPAHLGRWGGGRVLELLVPSTHGWCVQWFRPLPLYMALLTFLYSSLWRENRRLPCPWGEPQPRMAVGGGGPARAPSRLGWASSAGSGHVGALQTCLVCSRCAQTSQLSWELLLLPVFPFITHRQSFPENPGSSPASLIDTKASLAPCDVLSP